MIRRLLIPFLFINLQAQSIDISYKTGYESIRASDLKSYLSVLTSDSLEGRETTFPGQKRAANYIADIFKKLKLEAIGDRKTYFQHFDVEVVHIDPENKIMVTVNGKRTDYKWEKDFIAEGVIDTTISGPVAFVGFTDTELDSSSQAKLKGRIVISFIGKKNFANDTSIAATMRRLFAIRRDENAAATLMIADTEGPASFQRAHHIILRSGWEKGIMRIKDTVSQEQFPYIRFLISPELGEQVLRSAGRSLKQIRESAVKDEQFAPIFIDNAIITIKSKCILETKQTENVAGLLRGSDPLLKDQVIAITAHYDHLGKGENGVIYPGADDNGSGTATVLELAEAFSKNPIKPKRSLLFLTFTGEEKGLFGSSYYVNNPIIPLNLITSDLNIDMVGRLDTIHEAINDTNYLYVIGSDKISLQLDSLLHSANEESDKLSLDYHYNNEYDPEQLYRRSDHYNFAKNGIPVVFFFDGFHTDYHKPTDSIDKILFNRMVKVGRLIYTLGWKLANFNKPLIKKSN